MNNKALGKVNEELAKSFLEKEGYTIIEQNWQCGKIGELDFVVLDPCRFSELYLVFVEVKFRQDGIREAKSAVGYKKQLQLKKLSKLFLKSRKLQEGKTNISYDVIAISPIGIEHVKNIFSI